MATDAAASTASDLANAAVVGVSGVVTLEVHDRLKGQIDDEATKPPAGEENAGGAK